MSLWSFAFCQEIEILAKLKREIKCSENFENFREMWYFGRFKRDNEKKFFFIEGLFSELMKLWTLKLSFLSKHWNFG